MAAAAAAVNEPRPKFTEVRGPPLSGESEMAGRVDRGAWHWGQNLGLVPFGIQERKLSWHAEASSSVSLMMPRGNRTDDNEARSIPLGLQHKDDAKFPTKPALTHQSQNHCDDRRLCMGG